MNRAWVVAVMLLGCTEFGRRTTASPRDYAAYRRFRVAHTVHSKLGSGFDYLSRYSRGAYRAEVKSWLLPAERHSVDLAFNDPSGLASFLRAVPSGEQAKRATARLVELEIAEDYRARHDSAFDEKVRGIESQLATAEAGRRALVGDVVGWARRVAKIRSWGGRTSELDGDFIYAYRLSEPAAHCADDGCTKTLSVSYSVPEGKMQSPREAIYDVRLVLERGGVRAALITGPDLFTRLGEAMRVAAVPPTDLVGRAEAIGQATQLIALAVESALPASRCAVDAVSPVTLARSCDGVELRVISATTPGEEDRVVVRPMAAPSASPEKP